VRNEDFAPRVLLEALKRTQGRTHFLPGAISWVRILLVPAAGLAVLDGRYGALFPIAVAAATSDYLDGLAARRLKKSSYSGKILDFLADKFFISCALILLERINALNTVTAMITAWYHIAVLAAMALLSWSVRLPVVAVPTAEKLVIVTSYSLVLAATGSLAFPWKAVFSNLQWILSIITPVSVVFGIAAYFRISRKVLSRFLQ
jgi:phosphatidylglycerophosphate synthase